MTVAAVTSLKVGLRSSMPRNVMTEPRRLEQLKGRQAGGRASADERAGGAPVPAIGTAGVRPRAFSPSLHRPGRRAASPSHFLRCRRPIFAATPQPRRKPVKKAQPWQSRRFPLLGKAIALAGVLLALTLALQTVSGIVAEREGRLREAERSVAASLASAQTLVGPMRRARLQRDLGDDAGRGQGQEDGHRAAPLQAGGRRRRRSTSRATSRSSRATAASSRSTATC